MPKQRKQHPMSRLMAFAGLSVIGLSAADVHAASGTWTGATDNSFADNNWATGGNSYTPVSGDSWSFPSAATYSSLDLNNNLTTTGTAWSVGAITFGSGALALVIGDGTTNADVGDTFTLTGNIVNSATNVETISNPFAFGGSTQISLAGGNGLVLGGNLSGSQSFIVGGTVTLSGTNSFTPSAIQVAGTVNSSNSAGTLIISSANSLASGPAVTLGGSGKLGTLKYTGAQSTFSNNINFASGTATSVGDLNSSGSGTVTFSGTFFNSGISKSATLNGSEPGVVSGGITDVSASDALSLNQSGSSTWYLSGTTSNYHGSTTISSGTLAGVGANAFGNTTGISVAGSATLSLLGDTNTSFVQATGGAAYLVSTSATAATINVDEATALGTSAKTMTIGALSATSLTTTPYQLTFTGADNTGLTTGAVTGPTSTAAGTVTLNNTNTTGTTTIASYTSDNTAGNETLVFSGNGNSTVSGAITPSGTVLGLTKNGTGSLILNGPSTYSGTTTIGGGTVELGNGTALGTGSSVTFSGGVLQYSASNTVDYSGRIATGTTSGPIAIDTNGQNVTFASNITATSTGGLVKDGAGVLTLSGANSFTGGDTIGLGTLKTTGTTALGNTGNALSIASLATLDLNGTNQGVGSLTGSGAIDNVTTGTTNTLTVGNGNATSTFAGTIEDTTGKLALVKAGTGTITLSGPSSYTGGTTIDDASGVLAVTNGSALGTGSLTVGTTVNGVSERLQISNNIALAGVPTINLAGVNTASLNLASGARIENLSGNNSITSNINFYLQGGQDNIYVTAGNLIFNGNLSTTLTSGPRTFAFAGPGNSIVNGNVLTGSAAVGVLKDGIGSLTLSGVGSTYAAGTTVNGGKLLLTNASGSATGTGTVAINGSTSTATLAGTGFSTGTLTVSNGSHIAPGINTTTPAGDTSGNFGSAGTLSIGTGFGITLASANLDFDLAATNTLGSSDLIKTGGTLTLTSATANFNGLDSGGALETGAPYVLIAGQSNDVTSSLNNLSTTLFGSLAGGYTAVYSSVSDTTGTGGFDLDVTFTATPEPTSIGIMGVAAFGLLGRRRRTAK